MKPSELLQSTLESMYFGKRILGWNRVGVTIPFTIAAVSVIGDSCDGIEVTFRSATTEGYFHVFDEELPEIIPE